MNLNKQLKKLRTKSQKETAKDLNIPYANYNKYETTNTMPDANTLIKLADYFHITIDSLLEHEVPYLLDKSVLTTEQNNLIDKIIQLNREQCMLVDAYIEGLKIGQQKQQEIIKKLKGE